MATRHKHKRLFLLLACTALAACASVTPGGRAQMTAPAPVSSFYSSLDMSLQLAAAQAVAAPCEGVQCALDKAFDRQVSRLGTRLAHSAYEANPALAERVPAFAFSVAEKRDAGTASDAGGNVVVYRGVRAARPDEEALAFVMAKEMGHVIARHHDEKSAASLLASLVAQVLLPIANVGGAIGFLAGSAASAVGARAMTAEAQAQREQEAEDIALDLLARQGWQTAEVAGSLAQYAHNLGDDPWSQQLRETAQRFDNGGGAVLLAMNEAGRPTAPAPGM